MAETTQPDDPNLTFTKSLYIGMPVYWYEGGKRDNMFRPGFIADIGTGGVLGINVMGVKGESQNRFYKYADGVKHLDDPRLTTHDKEEIGAWDYVPWMKKPKPTAPAAT